MSIESYGYSLEEWLNEKFDLHNFLPTPDVVDQPSNPK